MANDASPKRRSAIVLEPKNLHITMVTTGNCPRLSKWCKVLHVEGGSQNIGLERLMVLTTWTFNIKESGRFNSLEASQFSPQEVRKTISTFILSCSLGLQRYNSAHLDFEKYI